MHATPSPSRRSHGRVSLGLKGIVVPALAITVLAAVFIVRQTDMGSGTTLQGSGIAVRQVRTVAPFTSVDLAGSNNVIIHVGRPQSVVVRADDNLIRHVTTRVDSGTLVIGSTGSYASKAVMSVTISVPALEALRLSGSGNVAAEDIHATRFTVSLSGSGNVHAAGSAAHLEAMLDGSGQARLLGLVARDVRAVIGGSGELLVTATDRLDASVPGSGEIIYAGNPAHVTKSVTGSGEITGG